MCEYLAIEAPGQEIPQNLAMSRYEPNSTTQIFSIRQGEKSESGTAMASTAHFYILKRDFVRVNGSIYACPSFFEGIRTISVTDEYRVKVTFETPNVTFSLESSPLGGVILEQALADKRGQLRGRPRLAGHLRGHLPAKPCIRPQLPRQLGGIEHAGRASGTTDTTTRATIAIKTRRRTSRICHGYR